MAEGNFRLTAEKTLQVLRKNSFIIDCILDVLRYDPLYQWYYLCGGLRYRTLSPVRTQQNRRRIDTEGDSLFEAESSLGTRRVNVPALSGKGNKEASRALISVSKKLSVDMSVENQVNELLNQARDTRNLAVIFPGWQAWL